MDALRTFLRRLDAGLVGTQQLEVAQREAARLGLPPAPWQQLGAGPIDLELLRAAHRLITGDRTTVRRARGDGAWGLAPARPGLLRTKPQAFRVAEYVEPAWPAGELKSRLPRLLAGTSAGLAADPVAGAAHLLWALSRAQPFAGGNERLALVMASCCLRRIDLPPLAAAEIERDPAYAAALTEATEHDRGRLERYLADALWDEALDLTEQLPPPPSADTGRWTLRGEHHALDQARARVRRDDDARIDRVTTHLTDAVATELRAQLGVSPAPFTALPSDSLAERRQASRDSALRGRAICPHQPIAVRRCALGGALGLHATVVVGGPGIGLSGALSAHLSLELASQPAPGPAAALLLIPDDGDDDRERRIAAWIGPAVARAIRSSPVRL